MPGASLLRHKLPELVDEMLDGLVEFADGCWAAGISNREISSYRQLLFGNSAEVACLDSFPSPAKCAWFLRRHLIRGSTFCITGGRCGAAEETDHPREVVEAALAHVVRNKVEAAYARSDLFERRRILMDDWARYLARGTATDWEPSR